MSALYCDRSAIVKRGREARGITLDAGARGKIALEATAPARGDGRRTLVTAEVLIDGVSQGPIAEALVRLKSSESGPRQETAPTRGGRGRLA